MRGIYISEIIYHVAACTSTEGENIIRPKRMRVAYEHCTDCNLRERVRGSNLAAPECDSFNKPLKEYVSEQPREGGRRHLVVCIGNDPTVTQDDFAGAKIGEAFLVGH